MGLATAQAFAEAGAAVVLADAELGDGAVHHGGHVGIVIGINLRGVWSCMKHELRQMERQGSGAIVNNASVGALTGNRNDRASARKLAERVGFVPAGSAKGRGTRLKTTRTANDRASARKLAERVGFELSRVL